MEILLYPIITVIAFSIRSHWLQCIIRHLDIIGQKLRSYFGGNYMQGNFLYNDILKFAQLGQKVKLTPYKFFDSLVMSIHKLSLEFGAPLRAPLDYLRGALLKDIRNEKELQSMAYSSYATFVAAGIITWGFYFYANSLFGLSFKQSINYFSLGVLIWQATGFFTFRIIFVKLRKKSLGEFDFIFLSIYSLSLYTKVGVPINDIVKYSRLNEFYDLKYKGLDYFKDRIITLIDMRQSFGREINDDLALLIDELWHFYGDCFSKLKKRMKVIKFIWLCIYFLSTYLISIYQVLHSLMD